MDITIDNVDLNDVPGYTPITKATPIWKRDMIEKKNQEKIEEYVAMKQREKEEEEKWKNVPEWKRKLMKEKEKEKQAKSVEDMQKIKEAEEERKARIKEEQERAKEMEKELENVPEWKREIMMKRGGAIKNWGDEREDINEQSLGFGYEERDDDIDQGYESNCPPQHADPVPAKTKSKPAPPPAPKRLSLDEAKLEEEWDSLPLWKREVLMKRGGAPTNWGDEREEVDE